MTGGIRQLLPEVDPAASPRAGRPHQAQGGAAARSTGQGTLEKDRDFGARAPAPSSPLVRLLLALGVGAPSRSWHWGGKQGYDGRCKGLSARTRAATVATPAPALRRSPPAQQQAATARPAPAQPAPESQSAPEATEKPRGAPDQARRALYAQEGPRTSSGESGAWLPTSLTRLRGGSPRPGWVAFDGGPQPLPTSASGMPRRRRWRRRRGSSPIRRRPLWLGSPSGAGQPGSASPA